MSGNRIIEGLQEAVAVVKGEAEPARVHHIPQWEPIATAPERKWVRTKLMGEKGSNICFYRICPDGEWEWIDRDGRTTITHSTFAAPSHWAPLEDPS